MSVRKSRIIQFIFFAVLFCLIASFPVGAKIYGSTMEGITWSLDLNNGEMTVSGNGQMPDYLNYTDTPWYKPEGAPWGAYITLAKSLTIQEGITSIGKNAFIYARDLERVDLPDSVLTIGENAFAYCHSLSEINLPTALSEISANAFASCKALESISLPSTLSNIGSYAFSACARLKEIDLSHTDVEIINEGTFSGCKSLEEVVLPDALRKIGVGAFYECVNVDASSGKATAGLKRINLPNSLTTIGEKAFFACSLLCNITSETTPSSVGKDAFYKVPATFKVTFKNHDASTLLSCDVKIGECASFSGEKPKKPSTSQHHFKFKGWDKAFEGIYQDTEYTAVYSQHDLSYSIKWSVDGAVSEPQEYDFGVTPQFWGKVGEHTGFPDYTPIKEGYIFAGWSPEIAPVESDVTYIAVFIEIGSGDINCDTRIDSEDVSILTQYLTGQRVITENERILANIISSDAINVKDLIKLMQIVNAKN